MAQTENQKNSVWVKILYGIIKGFCEAKELQNLPKESVEHKN